MSEFELHPWLERHGLESLVQTLEAEDVTLDILEELTETDLRELGLSLGMRRRLRKALDADPPSGAGAAAPTPNLASTDRPSAPTAAERRRITVVFVDLVGSTALAAHIDPEDLREHINAFQQTVSAVVTRYGGFVARFMGDGLLAYFGYPVAHEDDAERAVRAGLDAIDGVAGLATQDVPAQARVGIASGLVVVGDVISAGETRERSVVGETPNLAARLQAVASPGQVVVSARTRRLVRDTFSFESLGTLELKGFDDPIPAYAVGAVRSERTRFDARAGSALMPLLGRDMELSLMCERWDLALGGEGQVVVLVGEAGIGKSRITHALLENVRAQHHRCLLYQCSPLHLDSPLWPVLEQIRATLRLEEDEEPASRGATVRAELGRSGAIAPDDIAIVAEALGVPPDTDRESPRLSAGQKRLRVLHALLAQLLDTSRQRPLLVVIEDVHWIDPTTLELVETAIDAIGDARMMLLMTTRPEGAPELAAHAQVTKLTLNRLGRRAAQGIARGIAGASGLSEDVLGGIVSRTDGVPLFVEELTKAMLEAGSSSASGPDHLGTTIPETLHDSLMARLDRVPALKGVAQVAACIGREFEFGLLESVCDLPSDELVDALDGLATAGLVFGRGTPPTARYSFKHALVRDAAYESALNAQRAVVHGRIADALEARIPMAPPELVAVHATSAGDTERAISAYLAAGRNATRASANAEAVSHYRQTLKLLSTLPPSEDRSERELGILQLLGVPLIAVRGYASPEVEHVFQQASQLCETLGIDDARKFMVLRGLWNCLYDRSKLAESASLASTLVDLATAHGDPAEAALANRALGSTLFVQGDLTGGAEAFRRVLDAPQSWSTPATRASHGEAPEVIALEYAGWIATIQGRPDAGLALVEQSLERAHATGMPIAVAFAMAIHELVLWLRGDAEGCARAAGETRALTDEHGFPFWRAHSDVFAGWAAAQGATKHGALEQTRAGLDAWIRTGARLHVPTWSCVLADVAIAVNALDEAERVLDRARSLAQRNGELLMLPELLRLTATLEQARNHDGAVLELLDQALEVSNRHGSHWLGLRIATDIGRWLEARGDLVPALSKVEAAIGRVDEGRGCRAFEDARVLRDRLSDAL